MGREKSCRCSGKETRQVEEDRIVRPHLRYQQQPKITTEPRTRTLEDLKTIAARKGADTAPLI